MPFLISVSFSHFKSPHGWRLDLILRARRLECGFYGALTAFSYLISIFSSDILLANHNKSSQSCQGNRYE
ncbi:hypothetical protein VIBHAR_06821 [Vibrio campbellii ATCC BAA-1116]|uniref:Uncharacterized protein n=2 Tax=Vibrio campbellii (strain ATCC BAA-1116) TaxID=2902295 RepID=A7N7U2_VIBC1|nr:hypothetical protein VIBHAR_06821 [Vibrio campbellii ATCC BAA-1116]